MTVPIEQIRYVYAGPYDTNDQIPIPFVYSETDTVKLLVDNKPQVLNINYSVLGQTLTILTPVGINSNIVIYRETPLDQDSSYPQEAEFDSAKIEGNLDKLTMQNQEQEDTLSRCIKMAPDTPSNVDVTFPAPDPGKTIIWDNEGTGLTNSAFTLDDALNRAEGAADRAEDAADRAQDAADKAGALQDRAAEAKSWAIGDILERPEGSAWYWANQTAQAVQGDVYTRIETDGITAQCAPLIKAGQFLKYKDTVIEGITWEGNYTIKIEQGRYGNATDADGVLIAPRTATFNVGGSYRFVGYDTYPDTLVIPIAIRFTGTNVLWDYGHPGTDGPLTPETVKAGYKLIGNATFTLMPDRWYQVTAFSQTVNKTGPTELSVDAQMFTPTAWSSMSDAEKQAVTLAFVYEED